MSIQPPTDDDQTTPFLQLSAVSTTPVASQNTRIAKPPRRTGLFWISGGLLVVLVASLGVWYFTRPIAPNYQEAQVGKGNLQLMVNATGPVQSATYAVNFAGAGGKILELPVKVGDQVKQGQVIARLDPTSLKHAYEQQLAAYNAALANYEQAQAQAGANGNQASTTLNSAQKNLENVKAQAQAQMNTAEANLKNAQAALKAAQDKEAQQKQQAQQQLEAALALCQQSTPTPETSNTTCEQLARDIYNLTIQSAQSAVAQAQAQVDAATRALETARVNAKASVDAAQAQVNSSQSQVTTAQTSGNTGVTTAEGQLKIQKKQLEIAQYNLDNATLTAPHDGTVAVINGTIGGAPGVVSGGTPTLGSSPTGAGSFIQIVDLNVLQIQANINESDTATLKIGQAATFTVNAYGERTFQGKVSTISPIGSLASNVVTYPVTIDIDSASLKGARFYPNMTANVSITTIQRNNTLLIPVNAINFARLASSGVTGTTAMPQLLSKQEANALLTQAREKMLQLQQNIEESLSNPIPAFVLVKRGETIVGLPVVLGVTDGTSYEVIVGLDGSERILTGVK